ncbi:MAG: class I SAM-dependent methyltransferase [Bacteroidota bacterium]
MIEYSVKPLNILHVENREIHLFDSAGSNIDETTVKAFGEEWNKFNAFSSEEIEKVGVEYFDIVTSKHLTEKSLVLDVGCGSGRWSKYLADKVAHIEAIDPSDAVLAAAKLLRDTKNVRISKASADSIPFEDNSFDFVFSLGVLHHIPDTKLAMQHCISKLKQNGYFLVYLYYNLDNRGIIYNKIFRFSNVFRLVISSLPAHLKKIVCDLIAMFVYMPLLSVSKLLSLIGLKRLGQKIPLSYYSDKTFHIIRNDALDRFGTPLEQRFSKTEIGDMMKECGLTDIIFSDNAPYWHAIGQKI